MYFDIGSWSMGRRYAQVGAETLVGLLSRRLHDMARAADGMTPFARPIGSRSMPLRSSVGNMRSLRRSAVLAIVWEPTLPVTPCQR